MTDVTDASFQSAVLDRSQEVPVVVDLWAPWCGPCKTLGPIIERVVAETNGQVELAKVNVDENPGIAQAFRVQSIPAVFALHKGQVVDQFIGALPEHSVREFVSKLAPGSGELDRLIDAGDEVSLRQALELDPNSTKAVAGLASLFVESDRIDEAKELLAKYPETEEISRVLARIRLLEEGADVNNLDSVEAELISLLDRVKADDEARQRFVDLLTVFQEGDPRVVQYRRKLTSRLF
ncbi:MAG: thioredoxin [Acidimicrobiales bacterium]